MRPTADQLKKFLTEFGYPLNLTDTEVSSELMEIMGHDRYENYCQTKTKGDPGASLLTKREADLVAMFQRDVLCDVYHAITGNVIEIAKHGDRILDLGCWSGAWCAWMSQLLPRCDIVGVDKLDAIIRASRAAAADKYKLETWDYFTDPPKHIGKFDVLCCSLGIYFSGIENKWGLNVRERTQSDNYIKLKEEAYRYGCAWLNVANSNSRVVAALRIAALEHLIPFCHGFSEAGWAFLSKPSQTVASGHQKIPLLHFRREPKDHFDDAHVFEWFASQNSFEPMATEHEGSDALLAYCLICNGNKFEVIETQVFPSEPVATHIEVGTSDGATYVFLRTEKSHYGFKKWRGDVDHDTLRAWIWSKFS